MVLTKEERKQRQNKRKKNRESRMTIQFETKIEPKSRMTNEGLEVERRLNSPVLLEEIKAIDIRQKRFMDFVADRTIKYFSSKPQVTII